MRIPGIRMSRLLPLLVCSAPLLAQSVSVQLSGRVTQKGGAPVATATVVIRNTETGLVRTVQTDASGRYFASTLPVGGYAVTVTKAGFQTASNLRVNLNLGDAAPLNVTLATEASTTVEVVASVSNLDSERSSSAAFVSPEALTNLPVFDRSFTSLATLTPQVVVDSQRGNLAIAGQRGVNTSVNIDGGDNNEPFFGGAVGAAEGKTPFTISIEAIREYQVVTDGASAEFGRMGGGYVNAITKNGSNEFGGSLFYYTRPQSMKALAPYEAKVGDFKQQQFGFSASGPIIKDKLLFFVAYDGQRRTSPIEMRWGGTAGLFTGTPAVPTTLSPSNPADAVLISKAGGYNSKADSDTIFARFDWNITQDQTLQFRVNHSSFKGDTGAGITAAGENLATDNVVSNSYVVQWNWVVNANWLNEARLNIVTDDMPRAPYSNIPEVSISNVGYYGAYPFDRTYNTKRTQFQENLSYVTPIFQVKGGFDYNSIDVSEFFAGTWQGMYSFSTLDNFRAGKWTYYRQNFGLSAPVQQAGLFDTTTKQMAAYIQTDWRVSDALKINLGVRWDRQQNPDYPILDMSNPLAASMPVTAKIPNDSQFSPRFSFTYTPGFDAGKSVVRGSLGRYVSTTPAVFLYQVFAANGKRTGSVDFQAGTNGATAAVYGIPYGAAFNPATPYWMATIPTGAALPKFNIWSFSQNFKNPYTDRANLAVERSFDALLLGLSATYAKGNQLERTQDLNTGNPTLNAATGRLMYPARPNTVYGTEGQYVSDATSLYHAYTLSAKYHKEDSPLEASLYYTYSINKDTDSNERNYSGITTQDGSLIGKEWAYGDTDRRNSVTGYVSFHERKLTGILTSLAFRYTSGAPYSLVYSKDVNGDQNSSNDRFFNGGMDSGRNSQRRASVTTVDLALRKDFNIVRKVKFTLSADVFNLLNKKNTYVRSAVAGSSTDAVPTLQGINSYEGAPRQVQVGARIAF